MKERGMIFNGEMTRAILDGRKTQTRRPIKWKQTRFTEIGEREDGSKWPWSEDAEHACDFWHPCPFGAVGDRIWVRETFSGHYLDDAQIQDIKDGRDKATDLCEYRADYPDGYQASDGWTPSIHMPRWASRILLEITDVRVERLNAISEEDAQREGVHTEVWDQTVVARNYAARDEFFQFWSEDMPHYVEMNQLYRSSFRSLWESIYGAENWLANPWVWVIEFKRVEGGAA
ncbi:morphogenetic protein [Klebsiella pneumoniae]|nr:morphogenetic protein [Klebsiella pneumoniae]